jgi:hypothetical protein
MLRSEKTLQTLKMVCNRFYELCFHSNLGSTAHSFLEFNGLMAKYVELLERAAESGIDPHMVNEHSGVVLPVETHDMRYLAEKLRCIFGPIIDSNPEAKQILMKVLFHPDPE